MLHLRTRIGVLTILMCCYCQVAFCFWPGEHKFIGDQAFFRCINSDPAKMKIWNEIIGNDSPSATILNVENRHFVTYGDLTKLMGEGNNIPTQIFGLLVKTYPALWFSYNENGFKKTMQDSTVLKLINANSITSLYSKRISSLEVDQLESHPFQIESANHNYNFGNTLMSDELSDAMLKYMVIPEGKNQSYLESIFSYQFLLATKAMEIDGSKYNLAAIDSFLASLEVENVASEYCLLHAIARQCADLAGIEYVRGDNKYSPKCKMLFQMAFLFNAGADHYLQDAFAAGHLVIGKTNRISRLNNKGKHNYYNRIGLQLDNSEVAPWQSYGDGYLDTFQVNYQKIMYASTNSLNDLWARFTAHQKHPELPTMLEEFHEKSEKQVIAMCLRHFNAMRVIPFPVETGQVNFGNSKNGLFLGGVIAAPSYLKYNPDVELQFGFGLNVINGKRASHVKREADLWAAASISIGYYSSFSQGTTLRPLIRVDAPEFNFMNLICFSPLSYKAVYLDKKLLKIWNPSIGLERKNVLKNWSYSFKVYYQRLSPVTESKIYPAIQTRFFF